MLFKASSNAAPFSTSGVTSGGVTLSIPGSFVLVEIRALILCLDVFILVHKGNGLLRVLLPVLSVRKRYWLKPRVVLRILVNELLSYNPSRSLRVVAWTA